MIKVPETFTFCFKSLAVEVLSACTERSDHF